jgi:dTDP-glucose 4,6-dehydratase
MPELVVADRIVSLDKLTYAGNRANLSAHANNPRHHFIEGDIGDGALVDAILKDHDIDAVIHLAAETHVDRSIDDAENFISTNLVGSHRLLESFRRHLSSMTMIQSSQARFIHVSTDEVYGSLNPDDPPFDESTPYAPNSPYSASKAGSDFLARSYHQTYGLPVVITNCSNNYGPRQFPEKLIPLMIQKILNGEPLPIYGNGQNIRDWLYVKDHCSGLLHVLARGKPGETYLIGGRCEMNNLEIVHHLIRILRELAPQSMANDAETRITHVADRPGHDLRYAIDPTRIESELGWSAKMDFTRGIRETCMWYLENDEWLKHIAGQRYPGNRLGSLI